MKATSGKGFQLCLSDFVHLFLSLYSQFGLHGTLKCPLLRLPRDLCVSTMYQRDCRAWSNWDDNFLECFCAPSLHCGWVRMKILHFLCSECFERALASQCQQLVTCLMQLQILNSFRSSLFSRSQQGCWWGYSDPLIGWVSRVEKAVGETAHGFWHMEMEDERWWFWSISNPKIPFLIIISRIRMASTGGYTIFRHIHVRLRKRSASFFSSERRKVATVSVIWPSNPKDLGFEGKGHTFKTWVCLKIGHP